MPQTLDRLVGQLADAVLPAYPSSLAALQQLRHRANLSASRAATIIAPDPGLSLSLLRAVRAGGSSEERPTSVTHAVVLLGVENTLSALLTLPKLDTLGDAARAGFSRAAARAAFAARCALAWGRQMSDPTPAELSLAAQSRYLAELALWVTDPEHAGAVEHAVRAPAQNPGHSETAILGATLSECTDRLAARWGLPELSARPRHGGSGEDTAQQAVDPLARRELTVTLAAAVGESGNRGWTHPSVAHALACLEGLLRLGVDQVSASVHELAAACARETPLDYPFSPALALLLAPAEVLPAPQSGASSVRQPRGAAPSEGRGERPPGTGAPRSRATPRAASGRIHKGTGREPPEANPRPVARARSTAPAPAAVPAPKGCSPSPPPAAVAIKRFLAGRIGVSDFLNGVTAGLARELGLDRTMFAIVSPDKQRLQARFSSTANESHVVSGFDFSLSEPHLFSRLMSKPACVWVLPNDPRFARSVPPQLAALTGAAEFFAMSVFSGDRAVGLIYGDAFRGNSLSDEAFTTFRKVGQQVGLALAKAQIRVRRAS